MVGDEAGHVAPEPLHGRHEAHDVQLRVAWLCFAGEVAAAGEVGLRGVQRNRARVAARGSLAGGARRDVGKILRDVREVHFTPERQLRLRQDDVDLGEVLVVHLGRHCKLTVALTQ